jgi:hypothetical protein
MVEVPNPAGVVVIDGLHIAIGPVVVDNYRLADPDAQGYRLCGGQRDPILPERIERCVDPPDRDVAAGGGAFDARVLGPVEINGRLATANVRRCGLWRVLVAHPTLLLILISSLMASLLFRTS